MIILKDKGRGTHTKLDGLEALPDILVGEFGKCVCDPSSGLCSMTKSLGGGVLT